VQDASSAMRRYSTDRRAQSIARKPLPEGATTIPQCVLCPHTHSPVTPNAPIWVNTPTRIPRHAWTSDNGGYVPRGAVAGAPDGHYAHLPQYAAPRVRCIACVRSRAEQKHCHAYEANRPCCCPMPPKAPQDLINSRYVTKLAVCLPTATQRLLCCSF
jgi:hypothetical protein